MLSVGGAIVQRRLAIPLLTGFEGALLRWEVHVALLGAAYVQRQRIVRVMILQVLLQRVAIESLYVCSTGSGIEGGTLGRGRTLQWSHLIAELRLVCVEASLTVLLHIRDHCPELFRVFRNIFPTGLRW